jgi:hypothetical protein
MYRLTNWLFVLGYVSHYDIMDNLSLVGVQDQKLLHNYCKRVGRVPHSTLAINHYKC